MIRYYGSDYAADLKSKFEYFRNTDNVNPSGYSTRIVNVTVDSRFTYLRDNARDAALMANSHICNIQGVGLSAINDITSFHEEVDRVSEGIYRDACLYYGILDNLLTTVNNLCNLLHSSRQGGQYVTVSAINAACAPLVTAKIQNGAANLGLLYAPGGGIDPDNEQAFKDAMAALGITDLTEEEIELIYQIYNYLLEHGFTPEEIMNAMPFIYNSAEFQTMLKCLKDPYKQGNMAAFAMNMAGLASRIRNAGDFTAYNYMNLVDNLFDETGALDPEAVEAFRDQLAAMGVENVTDEDIMGYWCVVQELRSRGYTDEQIMEMTPDIFDVDYLDQAYTVGRFDGSAQRQVIDGIADSLAREQLTAMFGDNQYAEEYIDIILSNSSPEFVAEMIRVCGDPNVSAADKLDFMMQFALAGVGYCESGLHNQTAFGAFFPDDEGGTKQGVEWCAMYVTWVLGWCGYLDDSVIPGVTLENATSDYYWAGVSYIRSSFEDYGLFEQQGNGYVPCNGDLIVFSSHIGMVIGVDEENGKIYTVEGNIDGDGETLGGRVYVKEYDLDDPSIAGFCVVDGQERNMDYAAAYVDIAESGSTSTQ